MDQGGNDASKGEQGHVSSNPLNDEFAKYVKETLEEWKVPGLSIAVIDGDEIFAEVSGVLGSSSWR